MCGMRECPSEDLFLAFASGVIAAPVREAMERHLDACSTCTDLLAVAAGASWSESRGEATLGTALASTTITDGVGAGERHIGEYELVRQLGRGGMGVVREAIHLPTSRRVALKTVHSSSAGGAESLRREIRALRGIRHPGVVQIMEEGTHEGSPFFTMELVEGPNLATMFASRDAPHVDRPLLTILRRICSTLAFLHREGIVHRDLTPRNVLLRDPVTPVLVDFGLVGHFPGATGRDVLEAGGRTMGTLAYVAPEQIRGELVDARADLYSFGCLLYEALVGHPPFVGATASDVLRQHLHREPVPPSTLRPSVPSALEALAMRLLAKDARHRIGYAEEVAATLGAMGAESWSDASPAPPLAYVYRPRFVGREDWIEALEKHLSSCAAGAGTRVFVGGESGAGKTRLVTEVATLARKAGFSVVVSEGSAMMGPDEHSQRVKGVALHPLRPLLRELADRCRGNARSTARLLGQRGRVLADYEPALLELPGQSDDPPPALSSEAARARLFAYLQQTLALLAEDRPLLLVIDDMHWADDLTLEFIGSLPPHFLDQTRVMILGAYRSDEASALLRSLPGMGVLDRDLDRLDASSVARMVSDMLAMDSVPGELTDFLHRHSEGNPFFVAEYVRMAVAEGWLSRTTSGEWQLTSARMDPSAVLPVPRSVQQLVHRRLEALSPEARTLADLASVLGRAFRGSVLAAAHPGGEAAALDAANELVARQLVEAAPTELRFLHDKIRETVYEALTPSQRAALHRRAAEAIERVLEADASFAAVYPELAYHWERAGMTAKAIAYWQRAGTRALATAAHRDAVRYFETALALSASAPELRLPARRIATWERGLGEAHHCLGEIQEAELHLQRSLDGFGHTWPATRAGLHALLGKMVLEQVRHVRAKPGEPPRLPGEVDDDDVREAALAAGRLAFIRIWQNDSLATATACLLAVNLSDRLERPPSARPYSQLGLMVGVARLRGLARRYFDRARAVAGRERTTEVGQSYYTEAYLRAGQGRWDEAETLGKRAMAVFAENDDPQERETALAVLGFIARARGHLAEALWYADALRLSAEGYGNPEHEIWASVLTASTLIRQSKHVEARAPLERAMAALLERTYEWVCELRACAQLSHAEVSAGRLGAAERLADRAMGVMNRSNGPPALVSALDGVASLAHVYLELWGDQRSRGKPSAALCARARKAVGYTRKMAVVFPIARPSYLICEGRLQALSGDTRRALRTLQRAGKSARALGLPYEAAMADHYRAQWTADPVERERLEERTRLGLEHLGCAVPRRPAA
jgi:eukaryotic-like serine/threonine-protein kinase